MMMMIIVKFQFYHIWSTAIYLPRMCSNASLYILLGLTKYLLCTGCLQPKQRPLYLPDCIYTEYTYTIKASLFKAARSLPNVCNLIIFFWWYASNQDVPLKYACVVHRSSIYLMCVCVCACVLTF